jgi:uncharacterized protein DUF2652
MIADIGGYTKFMRLHRMNLAHAEDITGRLLKIIVKAAPLPLIEIEGDAAFFSSPVDRVDADAADLSLAMHQAFHTQLERMIALNMCACDACKQSRNLKVKFVGHVGEVATQTISRREKLVGVDVITLHRMLKNAVPVPEYFLMTESLVEQCTADIRARAVKIEQELEGLGPASLYYVDLEKVAPERPPPPKPTMPRRIGETMGVAFRSFPAIVGLRRFRRTPVA